MPIVLINQNTRQEVFVIIRARLTGTKQIVGAGRMLSWGGSLMIGAILVVITTAIFQPSAAALAYNAPNHIFWHYIRDIEIVIDCAAIIAFGAGVAFTVMGHYRRP